MRGFLNLCHVPFKNFRHAFESVASCQVNFTTWLGLVRHISRHQNDYYDFKEIINQVNEERGGTVWVSGLSPQHSDHIK